MSSPNLPHLDDARDALASFLSTLLGEDLPLEIDPPVATPLAEAQPQSMAYVTLVSSTGFAVMLDGGWLPLLSQAMLGEAMALDDAGADDLVRELAGQGYGAVRNALAAANVVLPDATFELYPPGAGLPAKALQDPLFETSFVLRAGGEAYGGFALIPPAEAPAPTPEPVRAAPRPAAAPAPPPSARPAAPATPIDVSPAAFPDLGGESLGGDGAPSTFDLLAEVELEVTVELGRRRLPLADLLRLTNGSVIELEKLVGEPLEVYANGRLIAEGEAVVIDEQFGIRITNLASTRQRAKAFL